MTQPHRTISQTDETPAQANSVAIAYHQTARLIGERWEEPVVQNSFDHLQDALQAAYPDNGALTDLVVQSLQILWATERRPRGQRIQPN